MIMSKDEFELYKWFCKMMKIKMNDPKSLKRFLEGAKDEEK